MHRGLGFLVLGTLALVVVTGAAGQSNPATTKTGLVETVSVDTVKFSFGQVWTFKKGDYTLTPFWMSKTEVTQKLFQKVMGYNPSVFSRFDDSDLRPVENLSCLEAMQFCNKLSALDGLNPVYTFDPQRPFSVKANSQANGWRLPMEIEWEYAAQGGKFGLGTNAPEGDALDEVAWYYRNAANQTHPVGTKHANALGLFDMLGNVSEWCDGFDVSKSGTISAYAMSDEISQRPLRGGNFSLTGVEGLDLRTTGLTYPRASSVYVGFRVVRNR